MFQSAGSSSQQPERRSEFAHLRMSSCVRTGVKGDDREANRDLFGARAKLRGGESHEKEKGVKSERPLLLSSLLFSSFCNTFAGKQRREEQNSTLVILARRSYLRWEREHDLC
jgi:hypothetical protein